MPLKEGVLKVNLGIPIVICCNKTDYLQHGKKSLVLQEHLDFIQMNIRRHALLYGATVLFTSATQNTNLNILYQYQMHRVYDFPFPFKSQIDEKDTIFVPSGFDSLDLINSLAKLKIEEDAEDGDEEKKTSNQKDFEDVISISLF